MLYYGIVTLMFLARWHHTCWFKHEWHNLGTVLLWPVNYVACTFSAYLKQLKWIGHKKEALNLFHWQFHSHGVTLPFSKGMSLISWVKYALPKSHSTKLPTGYSHRNSHTATFSFRILKMWVTLIKSNVLLTSGDISPPGLICLRNSKKSILKWKKSNSQESAGC